MILFDFPLFTVSESFYVYGVSQKFMFANHYVFNVDCQQMHFCVLQYEIESVP